MSLTQKQAATLKPGDQVQLEFGDVLTVDAVHNDGWQVSGSLPGNRHLKVRFDAIEQVIHASNQ
jgi:preprotein translocase subunit YajC